MSTRRFRRHSATKYYRRRLIPLADLYGRELPTSPQGRRNWAWTWTVAHRPVDEDPCESQESSLLPELRLRFERTLEEFGQQGTLDPRQIALVRRWIERAESGLQDVATDEGSSRQAVASRLEIIIRRWPRFRRAWHLKQAFIRNHQLAPGHARAESTAHDTLNGETSA